jgi:hypothetical protein
MVAGKSGGVAQSPWRYEAADYLDRKLSITVTFDNATRAITGATLHRDADCMYTRIFIGVGVDGTPNSSTHVFNVPNLEGDRNFGVGAINSVGLTVIEDVFALGQIAAAPPGS